MSVAHVVRYEYADYLRVEKASLHVRHEYVAGEIFAMAGGTPQHARIAGSLIALIGRAIGTGPCGVYTSDLRVRIDAFDVTTYPDAAVVCGAVECAAADPFAVINPTLLVEVTSPSTETYDRTEKLSYYQALPSVREILIVSHSERRLTLVQRIDDRDAANLTIQAANATGTTAMPAGAFRTIEISKDGESLLLVSVHAVVTLDDVYRGIF